MNNSQSDYQDALQELIQCSESDGDTTISWEQTRYWPNGAIDVLEKSGWIKLTSPATTVECPGCEENCFMPVNVYPMEKGKPVRTSVVACDKRDDIGLVKIDSKRLQQWKITQGKISKIIKIK